MPDVDVVGSLTDLTAFLKGEETVETSTYVARIAQQFPDEADQRSFALRMIIHYVGDIHQPLHSSTEVDDRYPTGDMGGNMQEIPEHDTVGNLHSIWDSVVYEFVGYATLPMDEKTWLYFTRNAE